MGKLIIFNLILIAIIAVGLWLVKKYVKKEPQSGEKKYIYKCTKQKAYGLYQHVLYKHDDIML